MIQARYVVLSLTILAIAFAATSCGKADARTPKGETVAIKMATTTSTVNSGLLDYLLPIFEEEYGIKVMPIPRGTGTAIKIAKDGNADLIMVHSRPAEDEFVREGYGVNRRDLMHNDFVIIGPKEDPAGIAGTSDPVAALKAFAEGGHLFISRGDDSGTHKKEKAFWKHVGLEPEGEWYFSVGQGMGEVLIMADEKRGYTMSDRATYIKFKEDNNVDLHILVEGDKKLLNPYGVIAVNPQKYPHVKYVEAMTFIGWLTSSRGQKLIADYKLKGKSLFYPDAVK